MAEALGCHAAYVAQVLNGSANLSMEQAESLNELLGHGERQAAYFFLLTQYGRAGTPALRKRLQTQMHVIQGEQKNLYVRFQMKNELSPAELAEFFSRWYIEAVYVAAQIPRLKSIEALARALGLERERVTEALRFLSEQGLLKLEPDFERGEAKVFLPQESPIRRVQQANWRLKAIEKLQGINKNSLHTTRMLTLPAKEAERLKAQLKAVLENAAKEEPAKTDEIFAVNLDFFRVDEG